MWFVGQADIVVQHVRNHSPSKSTQEAAEGNNGSETFVRQPMYLAERVPAPWCMQVVNFEGRTGDGPAHQTHRILCTFLLPRRSSDAPAAFARRPVCSHVNTALPCNRYDGHTLVTITPTMQAVIGNTLDGVIADTAATTNRRVPVQSLLCEPEAPHHPADKTRHETTGGL